jgi:uncharacterized membrane protein YraQ (UPF0718 family)/copper chaperone CopZ
MSMWDIAVNLGWDFWSVLGEMSPYLLLGFAAAGGLSVFLSTSTVERHLGGEGGLASLKAALFGVPLPLCSCGVIPVSASLRRSGAGKGPTTAFLLSTPQTGVDSILVTYSLLGWVFALVRPIVAFLSGLLGGALVSWVTRREAKTDAAECCGTGSGHAENHVHGESCSMTDDDCCSAEHEEASRQGRFVRALKYGFVDLPRDIGKALLVGLLLSALITALVPEDFFAPVLGGGLLAMLIMMLVGIPVYVCATASVPVAAALIARGVSPGAALVFLMTGPATNAATIAMIWRVMGKGTAALYLLTVVVSALAAGLGLDALLDAGQVALGRGSMAMMPAWVHHASGVILLAVLFGSIVVPLLGRKYRSNVTGGEKTIILRIQGMTCHHCEQSIRATLIECPGVRSADVSLQTGRASVAGDSLDSALLLAAVERLGYSARLG